MSTFFRYAAFLCFISAILIFFGTIGAFIIGLLHGNLSPWWFWPAGIATSILLGVLFQLSLFASNYKKLANDGVGTYPASQNYEQKVIKRSQPTAPLTYKWGKFQGWLSIALGVLVFVAVPSPVMLLAGTIYAVTGIGLILKRKFGFVMVYVDLGIGLAMLAVAISLGAPNDEFYPLAIALLAFWGVPAALYYPKRWNQRS